MKRIGLFGGSFNPPHLGHLKISSLAIKKINLDKLFWLVVPQNPFKLNQTLPIKTRVKLCNNLIGKNLKIKAIDFESDLQTSETHNTIKKALYKFPQSKLFWVMGTDNLAHFTKWKQSEFIAKNVNFLIFPRNNFHKMFRTASYTKYKNKMHFINIKKMPISSTEIRKTMGNDWQNKFK